MLWIKAFHIIAMVAWFAGIFYLPRLFVYHADANDAISIERFKIMERRLFFGIMTPAGLLTTFFGFWLFALQYQAYLKAGWFHAKLLLVIILWIYHGLCYRYLKLFSADKNIKKALFYRVFNELPVFLLIAIVILVEVKP